MKYAALLRGINVGGNTLIKMADLKAALEKAGFAEVSTLIASGNVVFSSDIRDRGRLEEKLERVIESRFKLSVSVMVFTHEQVRKVMAGVPGDWNTRTDIRMYIAFLKSSVTPKQVVGEMQPKENVDVITPGPGVVYMATLLTGLTKSGINKVIGKKIYQEMTIRNFNTAKKLLALMDR